MRYMSEYNFNRHYKRHALQAVILKYEKDGKPDIPARREAYTNLLDYYQKEGIISAKQADTWTLPEYLER